MDKLLLEIAGRVELEIFDGTMEELELEVPERVELDILDEVTDVTGPEVLERVKLGLEVGIKLEDFELKELRAIDEELEDVRVVLEAPGDETGVEGKVVEAVSDELLLKTKRELVVLVLVDRSKVPEEETDVEILDEIEVLGLEELLILGE